MADTGIETLALDLEGTLISNAISQIARPGLAEFLEFCRGTFPRLVIYTGVQEKRFRRVACNLILEGAAPRFFGHLPHVYWKDEYKDLRLIPGASVASSLIVDDLEVCILPEQWSCWIPIAPFEPPYPDSDHELARIRQVLASR